MTGRGGGAVALLSVLEDVRFDNKVVGRVETGTGGGLAREGDVGLLFALLEAVASGLMVGGRARRGGGRCSSST